MPRRIDNEGMAAVGFQQSQKSSFNYSLSLDPSADAGDDLSQRIDEYKHQNPEDVEELKKCIQDVLGEAERTAQERLDRKAVSVSCGDIYGSSFSCCFFEAPQLFDE